VFAIERDASSSSLCSGDLLRTDEMPPWLQVCLALELAGFDPAVLESVPTGDDAQGEFSVLLELSEDSSLLRLEHDPRSALLTVSVCLPGSVLRPRHATLALQANHVLDATLGRFSMDPISHALCLTRTSTLGEDDLEPLARSLLEMQRLVSQVHQAAMQSEVDSLAAAEAPAHAPLPMGGLLRA
jgi:hypothetical protein